ncbi:Rho GTPase-activating protein 11A [Armadillidium vulgare]|nr:Rho GTPase-activating protein 11A [Armadillidium vulgare]
MMHEADDNAIEIIKEELHLLGINFNNLDNEAKRYSSHQNSSKFLGLHSNSKGKYNEYFNGSPKREKNYAYELQKTPKKNAPKSPFTSKNKMDRKSGRKKKLDMLSAGNVSDRVFGCELDKMELCTVSLEDGSPVSIPKFVEEASNLIRKNVNTEGLFRKGGSAQRQNEIKVLLKKGYILPNTVHPIDVACLLKHFLRELPTPLIPVPIHILMTRCLNIPKPNHLEALIFCTLLLPKRNQDLLAYVLELISFVAASSNINLMDTHNLAIIFAPTLMPDMKTGGKSFTNEYKVTSDIKIMELLIEGASAMCRYSGKLILALENREKCQSLENLDQAQSSEGYSKKKRRSNSLHRFMHGLRRVVHGGPPVETPAIASPQKTVSTPPLLDTGLSEEISMHPDIESRKIEKLCKRKSEGLDSLPCSDRMMFNHLTSESSRPKKKPKIEPKSSRTDSVPIAELFPVDGQSNQIVPKEQNSSEINRHYSFRERRNEKFSSNKSSERRKSIASISEKKVQSCNSLKFSTKSNSPHSLVVHATQKRTKSFNLHRTNSGYRGRQRITLDIHHDHAPVGSNVVNLGPRGVPDGAEDDIRKSPLIKSNLPSSFRAQEEEFVENTLKNEEISENCKYSIELHKFKVSSSTRLVSDALEKVENETKELETIQDENFNRRLTKELRSRGRRSDEFRTFRSPSERKIESVRRRSKELDQHLARQSQKCDVDMQTNTPKFKGPLIQSPQAALRRGKPNSVKSGLPLPVKPGYVENFDTSSKMTPAKTVLINKRRSFTSMNSSSSSLKDPCNMLDNSCSGSRTLKRLSLTPDIQSSLVTPTLPSADNIESDFQDLSAVGILEQFSLTKELTTAMSLQKEPQENDHEWISAQKYMKDMGHQDADPRLLAEKSGNRPSIKALKEQKKVTSNLQLFSQLQDRSIVLSPSRRSTRYKSVQNSHHVVRLTQSDNTNLKTVLGISPLNYFEDHKIPKGKLHVSPQVPIISPLRERNSSEVIVSTPKIMGRERRTSKVKRLDSINLPNGLTPLPPRMFKPPYLSTPITEQNSFETPSRIPVRPRKISPRVNNHR